jgi:hypothetical protein
MEMPPAADLTSHTDDRDDRRVVHIQTSIAITGLLVWAGALVDLPAPLAPRIMLLAPLVIVPRLLLLLPQRHWVGSLGGWPALLAALPLVIGFGLRPCPVAAVFALPWLALALAGAVAAVRHGLDHLPSIVRPGQVPDLALDLALGLWAVAATFTFVDRLGIDTGFSPTIVLLTAAHFHFAGFGLLALASLLAPSRPWLRASLLGLMIGIPLTAVGFIVASDAVNALGALLVGLSGIGVAIAFLVSGSPGGTQWGWRLAGGALLIGMTLGITWSLAILSGHTLLDIDVMIRTHGALNATAVLLSVMSYKHRAFLPASK